MRLFAFCLALSTRLFAASGPPVHETLRLSAVTLNRLVIQEEAAREAGLLPLKKDQLPLSVQLYLRPSGQLNFLSGPVQKAAAQVRRSVAPGSKQKDLLRETPRLAEVVNAWVEANLPLDPSLDWGNTPSTDRRLAWPSTSQIISGGKADMDGRALAATSILRALGVPARVAWARGGLTVQYWVPLKPAAPAPKPKKKAKNAPRPPLGWWALLDPQRQDAEIDAYSLDPGVLARIQWFPEQELKAKALPWQRAVFAQDQSATARAAFAASLELGRLTQTSGAMEGVSGTGTYYVLTVHGYELESEGAMASMDPVDILTPYRPHLSNWGRELPGAVNEMELEAQGLHSDRPLRLRLVNGKPRDEWKSPPPALGVQHYVSTGLRRFGSVLQATRTGDQVQGVLLRADNLSPRVGWVLSATPSGISVTTGADGSFAMNVDADAEWVELSTPAESQLLWKGDQQRLQK